MAEDWRTAYGRVKMELDEYKETIVPAMMDKIQELERRWIPVTERLPEDDGEYLVLGNYFGWWNAVLMFAKDGRRVDEYDFRERWENVWYDFDRDCGHFIYSYVTHWMPLPEPPKENVDRHIETECANK